MVQAIRVGIITRILYAYFVQGWRKVVKSILQAQNGTLNNIKTFIKPLKAFSYYLNPY